jgi:hypothetical protein
MKFFRLFALLLVVPLVFSFTSCNKKAEEPKDKPADTTAKVEEQKSKLTKDDFIKLANEAVAYMKSPEFKTMIVEAIKEAAKDPATFDAKLGEAQQKSIEAKMLELAKTYGINSKEEMDAAGKGFENDPDIKALNETMMKDIMGVMIAIYSDADLLKALPKDIKKKLEDGKKMMESMIAPKPEEAAKAEPKKEEPKKKGK